MYPDDDRPFAWSDAVPTSFIGGVVNGFIEGANRPARRSHRSRMSSYDPVVQAHAICALADAGHPDYVPTNDPRSSQYRGPRYVPAPVRPLTDWEIRQLAHRQQIELQTHLDEERRRQEQMRLAAEEATRREHARAAQISQLSRQINQFSASIQTLEGQLSGLQGLRQEFDKVTDIYASVRTAEAEELLKEMRKYRGNIVINFHNAVLSRTPLILNLSDGAEVHEFKVGAYDSVLSECSLFERIKMSLLGYGKAGRELSWQTIQAPVRVQTATEFERQVSEVPPDTTIYAPVSEGYRAAPLYTQAVRAADGMPLPFDTTTPAYTLVAGGKTMGYAAWLRARDTLASMGGVIAELMQLKSQREDFIKQTSIL